MVRESLAATDLATYMHLDCDLYIHNVYHQVECSGQRPSSRKPPEISAAHLKRGLDWEMQLFSWLDKENLLLRVPATPVEAGRLLENIQADARNHFFVAGLSFWPPQQDLNERFAAEKITPIAFGLAKPDLLEIKKIDGRVQWKIIDAKACRSVTASHHIQIYFYNLCLKYILRMPPYQGLDVAGVWLPESTLSDESTPSTMNIKDINLLLLQPAVDAVLFKELPQILALPFEEVQWHYNPLCRGCRFESGCRSRTVGQGTIGNLPNISTEDFRILKKLLEISRVYAGPKSEKGLTDIEELHTLLQNRPSLESLERVSPIIVKQAKRVLGIQKRTPTSRQDVRSPILESCVDNQIRVIHRRNYTWPFQEDVAVVISVVHDPARPSTRGEYFSVSVHTRIAQLATPPGFMSPSSALIPKLANLIRSIEGMSCIVRSYSCQFYTWSNLEYRSLQNTIIQAALTSPSSNDDVRLCVGALSQGASLLQTAFQPYLLSGALLGFLADRRRTVIEYKVCLERMGLPTNGTIEVLRKRIQSEIQRLRGLQRGPGGGGRPRPVGQLAQVVILKKETERQLALPVPGYWDLPECVSLLLEGTLSCPSDEQIFTAYKSAAEGQTLEKLLILRNQMIYRVSLAVRSYSTTKDGRSLLVNDAKVLCATFIDICKQANIRKLFYMQQFEVLAKLSHLWDARMEGCSEAPVLQFCEAIQKSDGVDYVFKLLSGVVEASSPDHGDFSIYDKLLVQDEEVMSDSFPVEALLDDLALSSLVFPSNNYAARIWRQQDLRVQQNVCLADVCTVHPSSDGRHSVVVLRLWMGSEKAFQLKVRGSYRLSPRLVDFNTVKVLSNLFELDLLWESKSKTGHLANTHYGIPFLQVIMEPNSLENLPTSRQYLETGAKLQGLLHDLGEFNDLTAQSLVLKTSQHEASQHILSTRLSVIWGPPGSGKTHTISSSLVRLIIADQQHEKKGSNVIFVTAMTHAAIKTCRTMILRLIRAYQSVLPSVKPYLDNVDVQLVSRGNDHPPPRCAWPFIEIYIGTLYQLHLFSKKHLVEIDCLVLDEAGQVPLSLFALVARSLSSQGRIIVTGDTEQLAPILSGNYYSTMNTPALFGSILDCLIPLCSNAPSLSLALSVSSSKVGRKLESRVIQLVESFRLNPDLAEFISSIYPRQLISQKAYSSDLAVALASLETAKISSGLSLPMTTFLIELSKVMRGRQEEVTLIPPAILTTCAPSANKPASHLTLRPASMALIRLQPWSSKFSHIPYESRLKAEATVAATLVLCLQKCCPSDDIFVATPYRIQREAVKSALKMLTTSGGLEGMFDRLTMNATRGVTVETIERLQGSEASFVICLLSTPKSFTGDLGFLLERRRLNVAISRAKSLCFLITSDETLCPPIRDLANETAARGYEFLKAYQQRAWVYNAPIQVE